MIALLARLMSRQGARILQGIKIDGDEDNNSCNKRIDVRGDPSRTQPVANNDQKQDAGESPWEDVSPPAKQTGSADHHGGHGLKLHSPSGEGGDFAQVYRREKTADCSTDA